ncbi:hypothetical protein [Moraxella lacunata]|uniref:hypothetical protein n=1 Tax=Moraxella lacunata TaxID=477 RepID=UPI003EE24981
MKLRIGLLAGDGNHAFGVADNLLACQSLKQMVVEYTTSSYTHSHVFFYIFFKTVMRRVIAILCHIAIKLCAFVVIVSVQCQ